MTTQDERPTDEQPTNERPSDPPPITHAYAESFEQRVERLGRDVEVSAERFGREAEAAAERLTSYPAVRAAGSAAARVWGLFLIAAGLWLFASITLHLALPNIAWGDAWPVILIVFGLLVMFGSGRHR